MKPPPLHIYYKRFLLFDYKFIMFKNDFEVQKRFMSFPYSKISIHFDRHVYEPESHFYLYNKNQRVSVVYVEDLEIDFLSISEETGNSYQISSNSKAKNIFRQLEQFIVSN